MTKNDLHKPKKTSLIKEKKAPLNLNEIRGLFIEIMQLSIIETPNFGLKNTHYFKTRR